MKSYVQRVLCLPEVRDVCSRTEVNELVGAGNVSVILSASLAVLKDDATPDESGGGDGVQRVRVLLNALETWEAPVNLATTLCLIFMDIKVSVKRSFCDCVYSITQRFWVSKVGRRQVRRGWGPVGNWCRRCSADMSWKVDCTERIGLFSVQPKRHSRFGCIVW